ncbi:MAG: hypothetical protein Q4G21_07505 [Dermabacter sp.]|nr:hypothetical protein [Dermabacter sp.]
MRRGGAVIPGVREHARHVMREVWRRLRREDGNAVVEFVGLSIVLMIPLVYLVLTLSQVQAASFAADTAARQATRIAATETDPVARQGRLEVLVGHIAADYGVPITPDALTLTCETSTCAEGGETVRVDVNVAVPLPGLGMIGIEAGPVTVSSTHMLRADEGSGEDP